MTRMHEVVYVPLINEKETLEMMKNNPDLIQSFHGTTALRAVAIAQNGYKGGRSPKSVASLLAEAFGESFPLVYTSAIERPSKKTLQKKKDGKQTPS